MSSKEKLERRTFTEDFKRDAVNPIVKEGYPFRVAAEAVNASENSLRGRHRKHATEPTPCGPDATNEELRNELKRVRKQPRQAELEREVLKKATAID